MRILILLVLGTAAFAPAATAQRDTARDTTVVLEPIVVSVTRTRDPARRVPAAVSVRSGDAIALGRPGISLSEVLATVPGVSIQNRFNASRDDAVAIRGFGARAAFGLRGVRVLLDGIPQTLPDGQGQLTNVDLARIERIEVLRGGASALHGNAAGGVISLWSRTGRVAGATHEVRLVGGEHGTLAAHAGVVAPLGRGDVSLRVARLQTDGFRAQSAAETWRAGLRATVGLGRSTRLVASLDAADQPRLEDPGSLNAAELAQDPTLANPGFQAIGAGKDLGQTLAGVTLVHEAPGGARLDATGFGLRRDLLNTLPFAIIDIDRWAWGARSTLALPLPDVPLAPLVTVGLDTQWQRDDRVHRDPADGTVTRDQLEQVREIGPFLQARVLPSSRVALTAGVRYDAVTFSTDDRLPADGDESGSRTMSQLSWSSGVTLDLHGLAAPYVSVGTSFETPTTTELANQPDGSDGFNPALEPQTATHYEIGVRGGNAHAGYGLHAFRADVTNALIPFEVPGSPGRSFFRNAGSARHQGLELELTARPADGVELSAAWTEADYEFVDFETGDGTFDGHTIPGVPQQFVSGTVRLERSGAWLLAETRASGAILVDDANSARTDGWWVTDIRVGYRLPLTTWQADGWVGLENAFDERYVSAVAVNATFGRFFEPGRPRTLVIGMRVR